MSFVVFIYAQTHNRAAAPLMSITLETQTYSRGRALSFCLVHSKPHQNHPQLQTTQIIRSIKIRFPDFWLAQNRKVCCVPHVFDETEGLGDLDRLCIEVGHKEVVEKGHLRVFSN